MPWAAFNATFEFVADVGDGKNFEAKCLLCKKTVRCGHKSSSNLKVHLKGGKHKWTDEQVKTLNVSDKTLKRKLTDADENVSDFFRKRKITQADVDRVVDNLIICETLPHSLVDSPHLKEAVLLGLPSNLTVGCRKSFRKRLDKHHEKMKENLKRALNRVKYVATTADAWTKHGRSFLGMTAHWIDTENFERQSAALALKRLKGRHTHDKLAGEIHGILETYTIANKVSKCTTDSASNFKKAFHVFDKSNPTVGQGFEDLGDGLLDEETASVVDADEVEDEEEDDDGCEPVALSDTFADANMDIFLPPHQRCGSHIVNLIGSEDINESVQINATYKKIYDASTAKLTELWRKQARSELVATAFKEGFGVKLERPGDTRWNSQFDARKQIVGLCSGDGGDNFNATVSSVNLQKLTKVEIRFLQEYVWVLQPVALALDIIQREKNMFLGYLLPTVYSMERQLHHRRHAFSDGKPLKYCEPLARTAVEAIHRPGRFGLLLEERELQLAAVLLPQFKMSWVKEAREVAVLREALIAEAKAVSLSSDLSDAPGKPSPSARAPAAAAGGETQLEAEAEDDPEPMEEERTMEEEFFGFQRQASTAASDDTESPEAEVDRYLNCRSDSIKDCFGANSTGRRQFPRLFHLFLKYNTALPSSASVERLFSRSGHSFSDLRTMLSDLTLEMEVMLKVNQLYWLK
ncbi:hypothetical protein ONE63_003452 [Megalurothrips usitatus]|uniref:BED-type domain-containing protein n=1 Tax=Megalurothrips usitatus TaxID=439358 RepID=A0AAV7XBC1_9NEOP|nr:hypothetical protein ONE63_003452 [Megalurothrips usitatus]